jgi:hypothetical protein
MAEVSEHCQDVVHNVLLHRKHEEEYQLLLDDIHSAIQPILHQHQLENCLDRHLSVHLLGCMLGKHAMGSSCLMNQQMIEVRQMVWGFLEIEVKEVSVVQFLEQGLVHRLRRQTMEAGLVVVLGLGLKDWEQEERLERVY